MDVKILCAVGLGAAVLAGCAQKDEAVSYRRDVAPVLAARCASCHVPGQPGYESSGLDVRTYASLMKGTRFGAVVIPGDPLTSALVMLVEGRADPSIKMPHGQQPLTEQQIKAIHGWVQQGAQDN